MLGSGRGRFGARRRLLAWLDRLGALDIALRRRGRTAGAAVPILAYHRIVEPGRCGPFDRGVIDCTPDAFELQMETLARHCSVIGVRELLDWLDGAPLPPNPIMVTFDDGYRDTYEHALPILRRHGVRATFFVTSGCIAERRVFWWDRISYALARAEVGRARLEYPTDLELDVRGDPTRALFTALRLVKSHYGLDLDRFLDELCRALGVRWERDLEVALADELVMTWDHVRELSRAGMDVGSHTRSHRVLWTLPPGEIDLELAGSKREIEEHTGASVRAISYPVGASLRQLPPIVRAVQEAGYEAGFTMSARPRPVRDPVDRYDLRRVAMDVDLEPPQFRARLAAPQLA